MPNVKFQVNEGLLLVKCPFNTLFLSEARKRNGTWEPVIAAWRFDARDEGLLRQVCQRIFGTDGVTPPDVVTVRLSFPRDVESRDCAPLAYLGRDIARATGKTSGARLGDGVVLEEGGFISGGSAKYWRVIAKAGTSVLMRDVSRVLVVPGPVELGRFSGCGFAEIVDETPRQATDVLMEERRQLLARLDAVETVLLSRGESLEERHA